MAEPIQFFKNSIFMNISREMAVDYGLVPPTPEEVAERDAQTASYNAKHAEQWHVYDLARPALDAITDPVARAVLDLHHADDIEGPKCEGCDMDGYEAERPEWPCRTVGVVAAHFGIDLPDPLYLWRRP